MTSQILDYSDEEFNQLAKTIVSQGYAVLHEQNLTQRQLVEVSKRFGNTEAYEFFMNPVDNREISIVSGQLTEDGERIGMFGDTELQWHANGSARHSFDEIVVSLYCVEECVDTVLSICSQVDCFAELPEHTKKRYREIEIQLDHVHDAIYKISAKNSPDNVDGPEGEIETGSKFYKEAIDRRPLVGKHPHDGREYLYFMVPFIVGALQNGERINHEALCNELWETLFRSKYMFHHVFRRGDLLFMDQLHTIHRRSPVQNLERQLWRTAFDYANIQF